MDPGDVERFFARLLGAGAGLVLFLKLAYVFNRFRFSVLWRFKRVDFQGIMIPKALVVPEVWRVNSLILLGAVCTGWVVWWAFRRLFAGRPGRAARLWGWLGGRMGVSVALSLTIGSIAPVALVRQSMSDLPNVIVVSIDTLRADRLGSYGYERSTSPKMDLLASEGVLFEWAVSSAPNTVPSHMSIFTSLYPTVHGFTGNGDRLPGWQLTFTEYLRERGYRTFATTDGAFMRGWFGFDQGFERYNDVKKGIASSVKLAFNWVDSGVADSPLFLFIHCYDVHSPYDPPPPYRDLFTDPSYDGGFYPGSAELEKIRHAVNRNPEAGHGLSPADVEFMSARYDGGIAYTDHWIGELVDGLASRGLLENTWLFVTSDHGEEFTEHGAVLHEKLYLTVTHVPLIVRQPGRGIEVGESPRSSSSRISCPRSWKSRASDRSVRFREGVCLGSWRERQASSSPRPPTGPHGRTPPSASSPGRGRDGLL
ncbi:sulfatase [bacterium]|nr:sulfatase [bacterium]